MKFRFSRYLVRLKQFTPVHHQLANAHVRTFDIRLAVAMALRDGGVTGQQIKLASSLVDGKATPQLNHMRDLIAAKLFTREAGEGYCLTLAPKGQQFVDLHGAKAAAKVEAKAPVKVKGKRKAKAVKVTAPAETPTSEAVPVSEGQPAELTA